MTYENLLRTAEDILSGAKKVIEKEGCVPPTGFIFTDRNSSSIIKRTHLKWDAWPDKQGVILNQFTNQAKGSDARAVAIAMSVDNVCFVHVRTNLYFATARVAWETRDDGTVEFLSVDDDAIPEVANHFGSGIWEPNTMN